MAAASEPVFVDLSNRAVIRVGGPDARQLLQGIISNDVAQVGPDRAIWAALLTPQGKFLHEFFVCEVAGDLLIDCEAARRDDLFKRLKRFKLRSNVELDLAEGHAVGALIGDLSQVANLPSEAGSAVNVDNGCAFVDPRLSDAGMRIVAPRDGFASLAENWGAAPGNYAQYDRLRLSLGLPDGSRDLVVEKTILLEAGFDELNGVDWDKGCYMGQEVTARTYHRGLVKKRLVPVRIDGPAPAEGAPIVRGGREVGELRSVRDDRGIALIRLDALQSPEQLAAGDATLTGEIPGWMKLPAPTG